MAISCVSTITPIDIPNKVVRISADISADDTAVPVITHTVVIQNADRSTGPKKAAVANTIWNKFLVMHDEQLAQEGIGQELLDLQGVLDAEIIGRTI